MFVRAIRPGNYDSRQIEKGDLFECREDLFSIHWMEVWPPPINRETQNGKPKTRIPRNQMATLILGHITKLLTKEVT